MAATTDLAHVVSFALARGASVRLVGDDAQLASIAAGGVLRDIAATHGAVTLTELVRFTDPAEAAAGLAIRDGDPAGIGFYLDTHRVSVGDLATVTDTAYTGWASDRAAGRDTHHAGPHPRARRPAERPRPTRPAHHRQRRPPICCRDPRGRHPRLRRRPGDHPAQRPAAAGLADRLGEQRATLDGSVTSTTTGACTWRTWPTRAGGSPYRPDYVAAHVQLGYASTIHAAQGITADTSHTVLTGAESRQQLYVALTRGRHANHLHLAMAGDGAEHTIIRPDSTRPPTAGDLLERILTRDEAAHSATSTAAALTDPATTLHQAATRYRDALATAAVHTLGRRLGHPHRHPRRPDRHHPHGSHPDRPTRLAHPARPPGLAHPHRRRPRPPAHHRRHRPRHRHRARPGRGAGLAPGPHPPPTRRTGARAVAVARGDPPRPCHAPAVGGLPDRPPRARHHRHRRRDRRRDRVDPGQHPRVGAARSTPPTPPSCAPAWRCSGPRTPSPTPTPDPPAPPSPWPQTAGVQRALTAQVADTIDTSYRDTWTATAAAIGLRPGTDPHWPALLEQLADLSRAGVDAVALLRRAVTEAPLPDEYVAAAIRWRITRHTTTTTATTTTGADLLRPAWLPTLTGAVGPHLAERLTADPRWPAVVAAITRAAGHGINHQDLLVHPLGLDGAPVPEDALADALIYRAATLSRPEPTDPDHEPEPEPAEHPPPDDLPDPVLHGALEAPPPGHPDLHPHKPRHRCAVVSARAEMPCVAEIGLAKVRFRAHGRASRVKLSHTPAGMSAVFDDRLVSTAGLARCWRWPTRPARVADEHECAEDKGATPG